MIKNTSNNIVILDWKQNITSNRDDLTMWDLRPLHSNEYNVPCARIAKFRNKKQYEWSVISLKAENGSSNTLEQAQMEISNLIDKEYPRFKIMKASLKNLL